ncbi:MAG TPA: anti-sigma factor [Gemmatimonadales bacterium]
MNDPWTDRLSEYLDGELGERERAELAAHLNACSECAATLTELRQVVTRAGKLEDRPPTTDLWPGIAGRIGLSTDEFTVRRRTRERRFSFSVPQLIAASIVLVAASAGAAWLALRPRPEPVARPSEVAPATPQLATWMPKVEKSSDIAVMELRSALADGKRTGRLDSLTVASLEHSLAVIDSAIAQATRALKSDPGSAYLNHHLADTYRRKFDFLRQANRIASART